jgi:OOP family OmpA-OmpF porin
MKKMKQLACVVVGVASLGVLSSAFAVPPVPTGWYVEGNAGQSKSSNKNYGTGSSSSNTGFGWSGFAGFKFMPFFGAEVGYTGYNEATIKDSSGTQAGKDNHYSYEASAKGILPVSDTGVELFAKLGIARLRSHVTTTNTTAASLISNFQTGTNTGTGLYMGVGGDYYFTPNIAANLQWARAKGNSNTGNLDLYSAGLSYIFC